MDKTGIKVLLFESDQMMQTLADYLVSADGVRLDETVEIDKHIARMLPEDVAKRLCLVAIGEVDGRIVIAMANPLDVVARDTVRLKLNREIKVAMSSKQEILAAIQSVYHGADLEEELLSDLAGPEIDTDVKDSGLESLSEMDGSSEEIAKKAPVVRFVDLLLSQAVKSRASDIHIEPQEHSMIIRMRVDGVLQKTVPPARKMQTAVIARIKLLSRMDIAEHRLPQDGRFQTKVSGREIDVRASVIPTKHGEKVVMRILDSLAVTHDINQLGFDPDMLEEFKTILSQPHGIIIITGPTGSGKSTTLYAALNYLRDPAKNITTVEDPIEYSLAEINQIQINPKIALDFASCLRAILRQDPNIIFIGEIRDKETVEVAIKASLTGHLVLSTFHTNDAPGAISRLIYMGIEPYLLASTLNLVVAQRLIRKICEKCREPVTPSEKLLNRLNIEPGQAGNLVFYHGKGCKACRGTGYLGRLPIFEFLVVDNDIRRKLLDGASESEIRATAQEKGHGGLLESGISKILQGLTTPDEVLIATFREDIKVQKQRKVFLSATTQNN